jgi:hypothetical protein
MQWIVCTARSWSSCSTLVCAGHNKHMKSILEQLQLQQYGAPNIVHTLWLLLRNMTGSMCAGVI